MTTMEVSRGVGRLALRNELADGHLKYGDATNFVRSLSDDEVAVVSEALQAKGPDAPYFVTVLDQYRARQTAAASVETMFVDGHDGLAKTTEALVEANHQESI